MSRGYKFLVMQSNDINNVGFLTASLGGSHRSADVNTNVTGFRSHDFGGGHENDTYWNTAGELLVGFARWFNRVDEKQSYNMGNRIYSASNTYRFFRIDEDLDAYNNKTAQMHLANNDLKSFEITEEEFIDNILNSWDFKQIDNLFPYNFPLERPEQKDTLVTIIINKETNTWCWCSDYLSKEEYKQLESRDLLVKSGTHYDEAVDGISSILRREYRFAGNDEYYKRKALEEGE